MTHQFDYAPAQDIPGPSSYNPKSAAISEATPCFTLKSRIPVKQQNDVPGPNKYQPSTAFRDHHAAQITLSGRTQLEKVNENPAPSAYDPGLIQKQTPKFSLQGRRNPRVDNGVPGPGQYSYERKSSMPRISLSSRTPARKQEEAPGPGKYEIQGHIQGNQGRKAAFSGWNYPATANATPGPGAYDVAAALSHKKGITMGLRAQRDNQPQVPGPGAYNPRAQLRRMPDYSFGIKPKTRPIEEQPGPGQYESQKTLGGAEISMSGRVQLGKPEATPAPNAYMRGDDSKKIAHTIAPRNAEAPNPLGPAPNSYNVKSLDKQPAVSLSSRYRKELTKPEVTPGVGSYDLSQSKIGGPSFSMSGRTQTVVKSEVPGPGAYAIDKSTLNAAVGATLSGRFKRGWRVE